MQASPTADPRELRRVLWSSYFGTLIEFYDFLLYTAAASLVFAHLFFSDLPPLAGTIASLGTLAVGYVARPLGAFIFGQMGDRLGRRVTLATTMTIMGVATTCIGLLPTAQQVGTWAAVLLVALRVVQGIAVGGEWGGVVVMAYEHAQEGRRGIAASVVNAGTGSGTLLAAAMLALFSLLPDDQFNSWGWRIPFLLSAVLIAIGLWIRLRVTESPLFLEEKERREADPDTAQRPLQAVFANPGALLTALLFGIAPLAFNALVNSFGLVWAKDEGGLGQSSVLLAQCVGAVVNVGLSLPFGRLSDRIGRRPIIAAGLVGAAVFSYPFLLIIKSGSLALTVLAYAVISVFISAVFAPLPALLSDMFGTAGRYTGASLSYQVAATLAGGFGPLVYSAMLADSGGHDMASVALLVCGVTALGAIMTFASGPRRDRAPRKETSPSPAASL
ncbi:MFS transporter [Streptomyces abyssomicinicus]|uniref:MFS transporter n=1 Tax=Streptomyces abyssomicinicus TaxID=574929 RepID=UPI0013DED024|nr:MFS transporter [Streptomyces abyssomicinicus]